ncbi:hypothetical protein Tco_0867121 [Tanacetum coccineum]
MIKIEGVGSVRFKLHDGSVKPALNVKYVLGAARNILSLGVLTSCGYHYVGRKDTCKVYKRDQLVIRGWKIPNNLCYLEGEALQGRTCCGGNKGKKKIEKRVHFSNKDEVLGILIVIILGFLLVVNQHKCLILSYRRPNHKKTHEIPLSGDIRIMRYIITIFDEEDGNNPNDEGDEDVEEDEMI